MRPNVVVDGSALVDGSRQRGIGTYVRNLVNALAARSDLSLAVLGPGDSALPGGARGVPLKQLVPPFAVPSSALRHRLASVEHRLATRRLFRELDPDVFHSAGHDPPRRSSAPLVQTVQDLTPLIFDHPLLARERRRWERLAPRVRSAQAVIVPSRSSADQVRTLLRVPEERIHVIPHAPDPTLTAAGSRYVEPESPPYLLLTSVWGPHKGFRDASAVIRGIAELGYPHRLRIAGRLDPWLEAHALADLRAGGGSGRADLVGFADDLAALYRGAAAVLVTSRAEGFGLPALEAMAAGTPVVAFANSSLPEVVGEGGVLVPDGDCDAMVDALRPLLDSEIARAEAAERASRWAGRFSWASAADAHVAVYRAVSAR